MNDELQNTDRDRVAAYVLGSLDPAERPEVETLLESSPDLREYARWLQPAADALPRGVPRHDPPPGLKQRLMAEVERDLRPAGARLPRARWIFAMPRLRFAAAVALAAAAVAAPAGYLLGDGDDPQEVRIVSRSPDGATAMIVREGEAASLSVSGLSEPRAGVFQVWIRNGDRVRPSSAFVTDNRRRATAPIPEDLTGADELMVTAEPRAGLERPTGAPLLRIPLREH